MAGSDWSSKNVFYLSLMTLGYVFGEIAHFLINTTSREVARDVHFGDQKCFAKNDTTSGCSAWKNEEDCTAHDDECKWDYAGSGLQYQVLAGPAFIAIFTVSNIFTGLTSDRLGGRSRFFGRHTLMALGVVVFSVSLFLMGLATSYWQLVILRMGIAAGEAVCRPVSGSLIADLFTPSGRGLANGIFSWGVYYGYGLAYVIGIYLTSVDILGYGWRSSYVISAVPGVAVGIMIAVFMRDPKADGLAQVPNSSGIQTSSNNSNEAESDRDSFKDYLKTLLRSFFMNPTMLLLLLAACVRHTAGYCWAYNTRLYFQDYYPDFEDSLPWWLFADSVVGGSFGVFFGGFFSDRIVTKLGLHSRLWVLSAFTLLAVPFAILTLYTEPPIALGMLLLYYFCAETWFAILFTVIVEVCNPSVKAISIALFLFIMNNIGGNLPVIVTPIKKAIGEREAIAVVWPGMVALSAVLFFVASIPLWRKSRAAQ